MQGVGDGHGGIARRVAHTHGDGVVAAVDQCPQVAFGDGDGPGASADAGAVGFVVQLQHHGAAVFGGGAAAQVQTPGEFGGVEFAAVEHAIGVGVHACAVGQRVAQRQRGGRGVDHHAAASAAEVARRVADDGAQIECAVCGQLWQADLPQAVGVDFGGQDLAAKADEHATVDGVAGAAQGDAAVFVTQGDHVVNADRVDGDHGGGGVDQVAGVVGHGGEGGQRVVAGGVAHAGPVGQLQAIGHDGHAVGIVQAAGEGGAKHPGGLAAAADVAGFERGGAHHQIDHWRTLHPHGFAKAHAHLDAVARVEPVALGTVFTAQGQAVDLRDDGVDRHGQAVVGLGTVAVGVACGVGKLVAGHADDGRGVAVGQGAKHGRAGQAGAADGAQRAAADVDVTAEAVPLEGVARVFAEGEGDGGAVAPLEAGLAGGDGQRGGHAVECEAAAGDGGGVARRIGHAGVERDRPFGQSRQLRSTQHHCLRLSIGGEGVQGNALVALLQRQVDACARFARGAECANRGAGFAGGQPVGHVAARLQHGRGRCDVVDLEVAVGRHAGRAQARVVAGVVLQGVGAGQAQAIEGNGHAAGVVEALVNGGLEHQLGGACTTQVLRHQILVAHAQQQAGGVGVTVAEVDGFAKDHFGAHLVACIEPAARGDAVGGKHGHAQHPRGQGVDHKVDPVVAFAAVGVGVGGRVDEGVAGHADAGGALHIGVGREDGAAQCAAAAQSADGAAGDAQVGAGKAQAGVFAKAQGQGGAVVGLQLEQVGRDGQGGRGGVNLRLCVGHHGAVCVDGGVARHVGDGLAGLDAHGVAGEGHAVAVGVAVLHRVSEHQAFAAAARGVAGVAGLAAHVQPQGGAAADDHRLVKGQAEGDLLASFEHRFAGVAVDGHAAQGGGLGVDELLAQQVEVLVEQGVAGHVFDAATDQAQAQVLALGVGAGGGVDRVLAAVGAGLHGGDGAVGGLEVGQPQGAVQGFAQAEDKAHAVFGDAGRRGVGDAGDHRGGGVHAQGWPAAREGAGVARQVDPRAHRPGDLARGDVDRWGEDRGVDGVADAGPTAQAAFADRDGGHAQGLFAELQAHGSGLAFGQESVAGVDQADRHRGWGGVDFGQGLVAQGGVLQRGDVAKQVFDGAVAAQADGVGVDGHAVAVGVAALDDVAKHQGAVAADQAADVVGAAHHIAHLQGQVGLAADQHVFAKQHLQLDGFAGLEALVAAVAHDLERHHGGGLGVKAHFGQVAQQGAVVAGQVLPRAQRPVQCAGGVARWGPVGFVGQATRVHRLPSR